jgi:hypothetical protein
MEERHVPITPEVPPPRSVAAPPARRRRLFKLLVRLWVGDGKAEINRADQQTQTLEAVLAALRRVEEAGR